MYNQGYQPASYTPYMGYLGPQQTAMSEIDRRQRELDMMRSNLAHLYPQQSQTAQPTQTAQSAPSGINCRSVTSVEEARAAMIDAFGLHVFTDIANKHIYTKQISSDGTAVFKIYILEEAPPTVAQPTQDAIVDSKGASAATTAFDARAGINALAEKFNALEAEITALKRERQSVPPATRAIPQTRTKEVKHDAADTTDVNAVNATGAADA